MAQNRNSPLGGRWSLLYGPARIPAYRTPIDFSAYPGGPQKALNVDEERGALDELERRILAFELDPVNFFKVGKRR